MTKPKKTILVVDDEQDLLDMIKFQFSAHGYNVVTAHDGVEGLEMLKEIAPDLIILDLNMPKMGGIEFYNRICDSKGLPQHPVLIMTARANTEKLFKELDVDGFMMKPVDIDQLIKEAEVILERKGRIRRWKQRGSDQPKKILFVDDDPESCKQINKAFARSGYKIEWAQTGKMAVEKILENPPDLALIKLSLSDIPGDLIAFRLQCMPKTMDVISIVYIKGTNQYNNAVVNTISYKSGIVALIEYYEPKELLEAVDKVIQKGLRRTLWIH